MKIAVIGEAGRAKAWEKHLRGLAAVKQVIISPSLIDDDIQGAILVDDSINSLHLLHDSIRMGHSSYLVSQLPSDAEMVRKIYHAAEEANVTVQFSHWPTFSPSTQWIRRQIEKPTVIQIKRTLSATNFSADSRSFEQLWLDELAFIIKFHQSGIQAVITRPVEADGLKLGLQLSIRFDDGGVSDLQLNLTGKDDYHQRILSSDNLIIDCDVKNQVAFKTNVTDGKRLSQITKTFDPTATVEYSVLSFIKSIQQEKSAEFSAFDALKTVQASQKIKANLDRF